MHTSRCFRQCISVLTRFDGSSGKTLGLCTLFGGGGFILAQVSISRIRPLCCYLTREASEVQHGVHGKWRMGYFGCGIHGVHVWGASVHGVAFA